MSNNDETEVDLSEWSEINTSGSSESAPKVEFEVEEELEKPEEKAVQNKERVQEVREEEEPAQEQPEELEGIKTKGAEKRIKQLIRQRKEREEEIEKLRSEVENLRSSVKTREQELASSLKTNIDSTQGQITSRIEQAREIFKQAADSGDTDRMLAAQEEMSFHRLTQRRRHHSDPSGRAVLFRSELLLVRFRILLAVDSRGPGGVHDRPLGAVGRGARRQYNGRRRYRGRASYGAPRPCVSRI